MIQRLQSLYLLLITILMAVTVFSPLLSLWGSATSVMEDLNSFGIYQRGVLMQPAWGIAIMAGLSALVAFINIFLYKNRRLQIKVAMLTSFLIIVFFVAVVVYFYFYTNRVGMELSGMHYGVALPVVALALNLMAIHLIRQDEGLVRSLDRIR